MSELVAHRPIQINGHVRNFGAGPVADVLDLDGLVAELSGRGV
jgi:hypothetical protein